MSSATIQTDPLRIVLFGLPRAGKTALLAALSQSQDGLEDPSGGLARQRQLHYDELPRPTEEETVSYPVRVPSPNGPVDAVLIDCDGRIVLDMLKKRATVEQAVGALPKAILDADALLLVADAALKPENAEKVLGAFNDFLKRHEFSRGKRTEVVGLPVYLVLTKADLLAEETDSFADWMGRVEGEKRKAHRKLQEFIDDLKKTRPSAFGRLDLHLWATATKRPALGTTPAKPREPYGVAELMRQCLTAASQYRQRRVKADERLRLTLGSLGGVVAALALLTASLLFGLSENDKGDLQRRVQRFRYSEGREIGDRLHDWPEDLKERQTELTGFLNDPDFPKLPEELSAYVKQRHEENKEYLPYLENVLSPRFDSQARTEAELRRREQFLLHELKLPHEEWAETGAGKLRKQRLDDIRLLREQADKAVAWYQKLYRDGEDLLKFRRPEPRHGLINWTDWQDEVDKFLTRLDEMPSATQFLPAHSLITPEAVLRLDKVRSAREAIHGPDIGRKGKPGVGSSLRTVRDISFALGLGDGSRLRPALLSIPPDLSSEEAMQRWRRLEPQPELMTALSAQVRNPAGMGPLSTAFAYYPGHPFVPPYFNVERDFFLSNVSEAAKPEVRRAAAKSLDNLLRPFRELIRQKVDQLRGEGDETINHWRVVAGWLASEPTEIRAYHRLAVVLNRLRQDIPSDPVADLIAFIRKPDYTVDLKGATVTIPFDRGIGLLDTAILTIQVGDRKIELRHAPESVKRDDEARIYTYRFNGNARVTFRPGEAVEATLPLRRDQVFTWDESRSRVFPFDSLSRQPRQHGKDEPPNQGSRAEGVQLRLDSDPALPSIPDLLPDSRRTRP